ncbi:MAG: hypothetical protein JJU07_07895 [Natronohydrobacter sp.]|nr:hypothetical protein [Natronohydrobacter sp.]
MALNDQTRVQRLKTLADLKRDHDMARLNKLAAARDASRARLEKLAAPLPLAQDPALFAARQAHLAWATTQCLHLNATLAQQTAAMLEQRARTARSFGRAQALADLAERQARKQAQRVTHSP